MKRAGINILTAIALLLPTSSLAQSRPEGSSYEYPTPVPQATATPLPPPTAEPSPPPRTKKKEVKLPQSGTLASTGGSGRQNVVKTWGDDLVTDRKDAPPLAGSVSAEGRGLWSVNVSNTSEDLVAGSFEIQQISNNGQVVKRDYFSVSLKPGASAKRRLSRSPSGSNAVLNVKSWKATKVKEGPKQEKAGTPKDQPAKKS